MATASYGATLVSLGELTVSDPKSMAETSGSSCPMGTNVLQKGLVGLYDHPLSFFIQGIGWHGGGQGKLGIWNPKWNVQVGALSSGSL